MKHTVSIFTVLLAMFAWTLIAAQEMYRIIRIPGLGGNDTQARDINDRGEVIGTATLEGDTETRGFLFDGSKTKMLQGLAPAAASMANGLNENGDIAGQSIDLEHLTKSPVLWQGGKCIDLGPALRTTGGTALAVNDHGVVVGMAAVDLSPFAKGFIWDDEGGGQIVGTLEGRQGGANRSINNAGLVVGDSYFFGDPGQAHLVTPGEHGYETQAIGAPPPDSGLAWSINNAGLIVGMAAPSFRPHTAVIFTPDAEEPLIHLGTLPGAISSAALDCNESGVIVGASGDHPEWTSGHAFVILDDVMHDLNDLVYDPDDEWWVLVEATAINNRNEIAGWGETRDGKISSFLLLPSSDSDFRRGDSNGDGKVDVSDAILILLFQFTGGSLNCVDTADVDDSGEVDVMDIIDLLTYLFLEGSPPKSPFPECGPDLNADEFPPCEYPASLCR